MASPINDNLRREHRVGASLQPFQFNDTYDEATLNSNMLWAVTHLWTMSLFAQSTLIGSERFDTTMSKFERDLEKNLELGLPYYSYTLEIPVHDARFIRTRSVKRHNTGKLFKDTNCNGICNEREVNSDCVSTHHVDRRKYPRLYTLQDTYNYRDIFKYHLFVFVGGKIFTDVMFMIDTNRIILVVEPDITSNKNTTIKLNEFKRWMNEDLPLTVLGLEYSPVCSFSGNPADLIDDGRVSFTNMKQEISGIKFNTNAWLFCYSANPNNLGEMTSVITTIESVDNTTFFNLDSEHVTKIAGMEKIYCEAYSLSDLKGISNLGTNRIFQIPISKNVIPPENIMLWKKDPTTNELRYLQNADIKLYYPNVYKIESRVSAITSPKIKHFSIDEDIFRNKAEEYGEYVFESKYQANLSWETEDPTVNLIMLEGMFDKMVKYVNGIYKFWFTATAEATWLSEELTVVKVNPNLFGHMVKNLAGGYRFRFDGEAWISEIDHDNDLNTPYLDNVIRLSDYGISIEEGTPKDGSIIFITYTPQWKGDNGKEGSETDVTMMFYGILQTSYSGPFSVGDVVTVDYSSICWLLDGEPVDISEWGLSTYESDLHQNTKIIVTDEADYVANDNLYLTWLQSDVASTEFINPIADYMEYNSGYANSIIANAVPGDLKDYIPYTEHLTEADRDFIKHNLGAARLNEYTMRAKRLTEMLKDDSNRYEFIYSQLMDRTAYRNHANPKFVIDFSKLDYYNKFKPNNYTEGTTAYDVFEAQMLKRQFRNNHDECELGQLVEFEDPMYKFTISHDSPKTYIYAVWIDGIAFPLRYCFEVNFKTVLYLPCRLINKNSVVEIEIMKVTNLQRTLKEIKFEGVDNSIEVPHDFIDVSPQNMMISLRREVTTNKSSTKYDPELYESLTSEGIGAADDFGTLYYYEVAPDYEMHWLLFGMRRYVNGISSDNMKITESSATEFNYEDTLTGYKGKNLKTLFNEEFLTTNPIPANKIFARIINTINVDGNITIDENLFINKVNNSAGTYSIIWNNKIGGSTHKYCIYKDSKLIADAVTLDSYGVTFTGTPKIVDTTPTTIIVRVINEGPNSILITAEDEVTASGFYPTERRRFYQYLPYGKDANPLWITPIGKPSVGNGREIVTGYVRDDTGKIIERITENRNYQKLSGVVSFETTPTLSNDFQVSVVASKFSKAVSHSEGVYTFTKDSTTNIWYLHDKNSPVEKELNVDDLATYGISIDKMSSGVTSSSPTIKVTYQLDSYFGDRYAIIQNTDIYHRWEFETGIKDRIVTIKQFFDDPNSERFRVFCNGKLYVNGFEVEIDFNLRDGKFIRGGKVDFIFHKSFYQEMGSITADIMIEYLPYKYRNVFTKYHSVSNFVDCGVKNLTRPLSLKYYDIYVDGIKLSDRDIAILTATKFVVKSRIINDSTIAIYERAHDEDLYGNANQMKRSLSDALCDADPKFTQFLISKYS